MVVRVVFLLFALLFVVRASEITSLPGLAEMPSWKQYAGYVNITSQNGGKSLYYWFVESQNNPLTDPVVLWMQGGPGCSGLIGFFQENGPFLIESDGTSLTENPFSWNQNANVIYVEQPAGVGFSFADEPNGYATNDNETAVENYEFLVNFFEEFPQFSKNEFWITGESYGGVYVPTLAYEIETGSNSQLKSNLKGLMIGNPVMFCDNWREEYMTTQIDLYYFHGLASFASRQAWYMKGCDMDVTNLCRVHFAKIVKDIGPFSIDNLYFNFCTGNGTLDFTETVPECNSIIDRTGIYLNLPSVQKAIHASPRLWQACAPKNSSTFRYTQTFPNMLNYYNYFFDHTSLDILIYSGDVDISDVPHALTQQCLAQLNRPTKTEWVRWTIPGPTIPSISGSSAKDDITAGYTEIYDKYTYCTVRGAGHEVPQYQPHLAKTLFSRFLANQTLLNAQ